MASRDESKKCRNCEQIMSVHNFGVDNSRADGRRYVCNSCRKHENASYRSRNKRKLADYIFTRKRKDTNFHLATNLRARLNMALKSKKAISAVRDLGCTIDQFKDWIERQWEEGMSWENYGNREGQWSLDHEYPLSLVDLSNPITAAPVVHYTNYKPMWHQDNIAKGNRLV